MARRPAVFRGGRAVKRDSLWIPFAPSIFAVAGGGTKLALFSLNAAALALRPFTVVCSRWQIGMRSDQTSAAEDQLLGFGAIVVQDTAAALGITALPGPIANAGNDFFTYELLYGRFGFVTGVGFEAGGLAVNRPADSKAMRKVDFGQDIVLVAESTGVSDGSQLIIGGRILVKLH